MNISTTGYQFETLQLVSDSEAFCYDMNMSKNKLVLLVGQPGSGKSSIASYLAEKYGFTIILVSDLIRDYAKEKSYKLKSRQDYIDVHTLLLRDKGKFFITDKVMEHEGLVCVDGIRVPAHIEKLQKQGALAIGLTAPISIRFERAMKRAGLLDKKSLLDFEQEEIIEAKNQDIFVQNTNTALLMASEYVDTTGSTQSVEKLIDVIILSIRL